MRFFITLLLIIALNSHAFASNDSCNAYPDLYYEYQLAIIDNNTTISFDFTPQVKRYLQIYIDSRKQQVSNMLSIGQLYFPIIEKVLAEYNLPSELKYLAAVESALDPRAISKSDAVGLWQFKINSGQLYGLNVSQYVDERMDPKKSTEAACRYLESLYKQFNNWHLALAAYNIGPTALQSIIKKNKGVTDFWKIYPLLPEAAQNYVPAFIAATYIMQNAKAHGIEPAAQTITFSDTDTLIVSKNVDFASITKNTSISQKMLVALNPQYFRDFIPSNKSIRIPSGSKNELFERLETIYSQTSSPQEFNNQAIPTRWIKHTVVSGDSMIKIANTYHCTINDIRLWNPEIDTVLSIGYQLKIQIPDL